MIRRIAPSNTWKTGTKSIALKNNFEVSRMSPGYPFRSLPINLTALAWQVHKQNGAQGKAMRARKELQAREKKHDYWKLILATFRSLISSFGRGVFPIDWLKKQDCASGTRVITKFCTKKKTNIFNRFLNKSENCLAITTYWIAYIYCSCYLIQECTYDAHNFSKPHKRNFKVLNLRKKSTIKLSRWLSRDKQ